MTTEPIPAAGPGPLKLGPNEVMEHDQIVAYIAFRTAEDVTYVDQSREMGMSDGWVSDIANAVIKRALYPTRKKVTEKLKEKYGAAGIPQADPTPIITRAVGPKEAADRGFGPRSGDPNRPLADLHEAPPASGIHEVPDEADLEDEDLEEAHWHREAVAKLVKEHTPDELAELLIQARQLAHAAEQGEKAKHREFEQASMKIMELASRVTAMDNAHLRYVGEIQERNATIEGQAEDLRQLEMAMDIQSQTIEDLQGFKDGVTTQLRQFAVLLWQVVPQELWPQSGGDFRMAGTETGRFSASSPVRSTIPGGGWRTENPDANVGETLGNFVRVDMDTPEGQTVILDLARQLGYEVIRRQQERRDALDMG